MKRGKLDARYTGYGRFKYFVGFRYKEMDEFVAVRKWCWETFGASCEMQIYDKVTNPNTTWSWVLDDYRSRIYFATEKEYNWFLLKWS